MFIVNWRFNICMYFRLHESCAQFIICICCALSVCTFCAVFSYLVPFNCQFSVAVEQKELGLEAENRELLAFRRKNSFQVNGTISHV